MFLCGLYLQEFFFYTSKVVFIVALRACSDEVYLVFWLREKLEKFYTQKTEIFFLNFWVA
jgi:hypothetical protein